MPALLVCCGSLSGCFSHSQAPTVRWGLGLELPDATPPPGKFPAGYERLTVLENFTLEISNRTLKACDRGWRLPEIRQDLADGYHRRALTAGGICAARIINDPERDSRIQEWKKQGIEPEKWEALRAEARLALDRWISELANRTIPGTYLEIELMDYIMNEELDMEDWYSLALLNRFDYSQTGRINALGGSYDNMYGPINRSAFNIAILQEFPWSGGCAVQSEALNAAARALLARDAVLAAQAYPEDSGDNFLTMRGDLVQTLPKELNRSIEHGWPESVLNIYWQLKMHEYAWQNWDSWNPLPTAAEADYLVAKHRNETRSLLTDQIAHYYHGQAQNAGEKWETKAGYQDIAKQILAFQELRPDWSFVSCPNLTVSTT